MTREIKFRAWDTARGRWLSDFAGEFTSYDFPTRWGGFVQDDVIINTDHNDIIIEQYTGLKDKNGVEIYEGDILESVMRDPNKMGVDAPLIRERFIVAWLELECRFTIQYNRSEKLTIIGNRKENPELLEQS